MFLEFPLGKWEETCRFGRVGVTFDNQLTHGGLNKLAVILHKTFTRSFTRGTNVCMLVHMSKKFGQEGASLIVGIWAGSGLVQFRRQATTWTDDKKFKDAV